MRFSVLLMVAAAALVTAQQPSQTRPTALPFHPDSGADDPHYAWGDANNHEHGDGHEVGSPHIAEHHQHDTRGENKVVPGVYVCKGPGWTNSCFWASAIPNVCMALPDSNTLAVGPDVGIQCQLYAGKNCQGSATSGSLVRPGAINIGKGYDGLPNAPKSYQCRTCGAGNLNCGTDGVPANYRWIDIGPTTTHAQWGGS